MSGTTGVGNAAWGFYEDKMLTTEKSDGHLRKIGYLLLWVQCLVLQESGTVPRKYVCN